MRPLSGPPPAGTAEFELWRQVKERFAEPRELWPFLTFAEDDATPSVTGGRNFRTANANATAITDFDGGIDGQEIVVKIDDANTTVDFTSTNLKGNGGSDWSPGDGDHMRCVYDGLDAVWLCEISEN